MPGNQLDYKTNADYDIFNSQNGGNSRTIQLPQI